jgi:hypothetical protein
VEQTITTHVKFDQSGDGFGARASMTNGFIDDLAEPITLWIRGMGDASLSLDRAGEIIEALTAASAWVSAQTKEGDNGNS